MDDLPDRHVQKTRPFEHAGIDSFEPLSIKHDEELKRAYDVILTCATTRLVHLELVPYMNTSQLLNALRRFLPRRDVPASMTSDNGPDFLLAE
ncbi:hypothetical protein ANCCEY_12267 [Ancylostoma ceylanicum]|uniref:Integrase catalytic domain-containing protein n=1 Tax=Ancylostoma ceylanicum TaxID=53326 RepID=A0A0D6LBL1_9BILA|nr:hypothetical protein ANCCEY_12267 [Ancylostoma ceylanicum]